MLELFEFLKRLFQPRDELSEMNRAAIDNLDPGVTPDSAQPGLATDYGATRQNLSHLHVTLLRWITRQGQASFEDIVAFLNTESSSTCSLETVNQLLNQLCEQGVLTQLPGKGRVYKPTYESEFKRTRTKKRLPKSIWDAMEDK